MKMTFGKFIGWQVDELPLSYLTWLYESDFAKPALLETVRREILSRLDDGEPMGGGAVMSKKHLQRIYRTLALEHHPDITGGNSGVMAGINLFYELIR